MYEHVVSIEDAPKGTHTKVKNLIKEAGVSWSYSKPEFTIDADDALLAALIEIEGVFLVLSVDDPTDEVEPVEEETEEVVDASALAEEESDAPKVKLVPAWEELKPVVKDEEAPADPTPVSSPSKSVVEVYCLEGRFPVAALHTSYPLPRYSTAQGEFKKLRIKADYKDKLHHVEVKDASGKVTAIWPLPKGA